MGTSLETSSAAKYTSACVPWPKSLSHSMAGGISCVKRMTLSARAHVRQRGNAAFYYHHSIIIVINSKINNIN